jgi:hypothetical protein
MVRSAVLMMSICLRNPMSPATLFDGSAGRARPSGRDDRRGRSELGHIRPVILVRCALQAGLPALNGRKQTCAGLDITREHDEGCSAS